MCCNKCCRVKQILNLFFVETILYYLNKYPKFICRSYNRRIAIEKLITKIPYMFNGRHIWVTYHAKSCICHADKKSKYSL